MEQHYKNTTDNYSLQDLGLKCSAWKRLCLNYPKLMQIIRNLAEIVALPKCIRNSIVVKLSYYQKSGFKSVFLEFGPGKAQNWSDLSLILSEIWSVFGLILAILGPEYKVEALEFVCLTQLCTYVLVTKEKLNTVEMGWSRDFFMV